MSRIFRNWFNEGSSSLCSGRLPVSVGLTVLPSNVLLGDKDLSQFHSSLQIHTYIPFLLVKNDNICITYKEILGLFLILRYGSTFGKDADVTTVMDAIELRAFKYPRYKPLELPKCKDVRHIQS